MVMDGFGGRMSGGDDKMQDLIMSVSEALVNENGKDEREHLKRTDRAS